MSCSDCEKTQEEGLITYYRWKFATVAIVACAQHAKEILSVLNREQADKSKDAP